MKELIKLSRELVENLLDGNKKKLGKEYYLMFTISKFILLKERILKKDSANKILYFNNVKYAKYIPAILSFADEIKKNGDYKIDNTSIMLKENNIDLEIHISTQASTLNYEAVDFWKKEGASRVVLARELSKDEIKEIIDRTGMEIECFVHGAMCSSYSGRCVLSNYFTNRDANRGGCAQICRWEMPLFDKDNNEIKSDTLFTASSKDLMMARKIKEMIDIGIVSLKVEGRMRSNYYVATVINTYRGIIDDYYANKLTEDKLDYYTKVLERVANREAVVQFWDKLPTVNEQYYLGRNEASNQDFLGIVLDYDEENKMVTITERNYFEKGIEVEVFGPNIETFSFIMPDIYNEENEVVEAARHPEEILRFKLDKKVYKNDMIRVKIS